MTNPNTGKVPLTVYVDPPPDGKEWHEKWLYNALDPEINQYVVHVEWRLRPVVSATVMVEMTREDAEVIADRFQRGHYTNAAESRMAEAFTVALARKPCGRKDWHTAHDDCNGRLPNRKPCPVMVCGLRQTACYSDEPDRCLDRRPCKHKDGEGHGGGHE